jgi:hypothetical protein
MLEVLTGLRTPRAETGVGTALPCYYVWKERAVQGQAAAYKPRRRRPVVSPEGNRQVCSGISPWRDEIWQVIKPGARTAQQGLSRTASAEALGS